MLSYLTPIQPKDDNAESPFTTASSTTREEAVKLATHSIDRYYEIELFPSSKHPSVILPENQRVLAQEYNNILPRPNQYGGFIRFTPKETSTYIVWINPEAWVDIRDSNNKSITAADANMYCLNEGESYKKAVHFELKKGINHALGIHSSEGKKINIAIRKL